MRSKHLSVRKCIDKKPDKIKGIVCICIILAYTHYSLDFIRFFINTFAH